MVASIGAVVAPAQCVSYFERDDYYGKNDRVPWKGTVSQRVRIPPGNCRSSR